MSNELIGAIIGGAIGIIGTLSTMLLVTLLSNSRRTKSIRAIAAGEVTSIKEKAQRYVDGHSDIDELGASTPMLTSIASELGYLSREQVIALRRAVTLDMEMRMKGSKEKAALAIDACNIALRYLKLPLKN